MKRVLVFSVRNFRELIRDPLSYIFCLGFPLVMLIIMTVVNKSIPPEAGMTIFNIENLSCGIAMFGLSFVMLFTTLSVSKDRSGAFLTRLYASPMKSMDFIAGYMLPCLVGCGSTARAQVGLFSMFAGRCRSITALRLQEWLWLLISAGFFRTWA